MTLGIMYLTRHLLKTDNWHLFHLVIGKISSIYLHPQETMNQKLRKIGDCKLVELVSIDSCILPSAGSCGAKLRMWRGQGACRGCRCKLWRASLRGRAEGALSLTKVLSLCTPGNQMARSATTEP